MFRYFGAKSHLISQIKANMPRSYENYCELFGGSGKVSFEIRPVEYKVWNDLDTDLYDIFYTVRNNFQPFFKALLNVEFGKMEYNRMRVSCPTTQLDRAVKAYVCLAQARNGMKAASFSETGRMRRGYEETYSLWSTHLRRLSWYSQQLQYYKLYNLSYDDDTFRQFDAPSTLWYLDPTYVATTRTSLSVYDHEFTMLDQVKFLRWVLTMKGRVMISGYESALYRMMLPGWRIIECECYNRCSAGTGAIMKKSAERLYLNY